MCGQHGGDDGQSSKKLIARVVLPENVRPVHYNIDVVPDLEKFTFAGHCTITLDVKQATDNIQLNAAELTWKSVKVIQGDATHEIDVASIVSSYNQKDEVATISLPSSLSVGEATLVTTFDGILNDQMKAQEPLLCALFLLFILVGSLTIMNMLVGVLVEVVGVVAATEKEGMAVTAVNYQLREAMDHLGVSHDAKALLSKKQFCDLLAHQEVAAVLQEVGVDVVGLMDMADVIYEDKAHDMKTFANPNADQIAVNLTPTMSVNAGLSFADFIDVVLNMRGTNPATVKDVEKQARVQKNATKHLLDAMLESIRADLDQMRAEIGKIQDESGSDTESKEEGGGTGRRTSKQSLTGGLTRCLSEESILN